MKKLLILIFLLPLLTTAQSDTTTGIQWTTGLSWDQIKQKAKQENKYIFVDAYATWCQPCLWMDKNVYSNYSIGKLANENFISIKLQIDTSNNDNKTIKMWYKFAHDIAKEYNISELPSYLFFSANGKIVHQDVGLKRVDDFVGLLNIALDTNRQIFSRLDNYKKGKKSYSDLPELANAARRFSQKELATQIAQDYIDNYLFSLPYNELYNKQNVAFIASYTQDTKGKGFNLFLNNLEKIDSIAGAKNYAQSVVDFAITKELITPILLSLDQKNKNPNWVRLKSNIKKKFNKKYAERIIINAKINWYGYKNDWDALAKYNIKKVKKYGVDTAGMAIYFFNNMIWEVFFLHCNNQKQLAEAIKWIEPIINRTNEVVFIDTYANLLYKNKRVNEAIAWQEKAVKMENDKQLKDAKAIPDRIYLETLEKMKKGQKTW